MHPSTPILNRCLQFLHRKLMLRLIHLVTVALGAALLPQAADAGAWTLGKGNLWSKVTFLSQTTDEHYDGGGSAVKMPLDARYQTRQVFFDLFYGVKDGIDLGLQIPLVRNKFVDKDDGNDVATPPPALETESGLSDLRGYAKFKLLDQSQLVGTLKLGFKTPIGEYRPVPEALSVTDGQWDFEVVGQIGRSFWPLPVYTNFDLGYRIRGEYKDTDGVEPDRSYTPGPELVFNAEAGYSPMDRLLVALKFEGLSGAKYDALSNPGEPEKLSQSVTYLAPTVLVDLNPDLSIEASARMTASGNRYFAGPTWTVGLSYTGTLVE